MEQGQKLKRQNRMITDLQQKVQRQNDTNMTQNGIITSLQQQLAKSEQTEEKKEAVSCVCGAVLNRRCANDAYDGTGVACDICGKSCDQDDVVYHCTRGKVEAHQHGYDICESCTKQKWRNAAYSDSDTGMKSDDASWKCLVSLQLPKKKGKFVCRYSFIAFAEKGGKDDGPFIGYKVKLGSNNLHNAHGAYLHHKHDTVDGVPLSGSVIVELKGSENEQERYLGIYHCGTSFYPSRVKKPFIESWEI